MSELTWPIELEYLGPGYPADMRWEARMKSSSSRVILAHDPTAEGAMIKLMHKWEMYVRTDPDRSVAALKAKILLDKPN